MKTDLAILNSNGDGWDAVPLGTDSLIRGKLIKFNSEGRFFCAEVDVSNSQLAVTGVVSCWLRWGDDGKPAETLITQRGEASLSHSNQGGRGLQHPARSYNEILDNGRASRFRPK